MYFDTTWMLLECYFDITWILLGYLNTTFKLRKYYFQIM